MAILFGFMRLRFRVTPKVNLLINAPAERVFDVVDVTDGKFKDYGNSRVQHTLIDAAQRLYKFTYTTVLARGRERTFEAFFRITEHQPGKWLRLERAGIEGKSQNNELLVIDQKLTPEGSGTLLQTEYEWGPRPLLAQLLARVDLLGGCHRLKGIIENGIPNERMYRFLSAMLALVSGIITFLTFLVASAELVGSYKFGLVFSSCILFALFVHEFGHLLAFRLIGQPWGRMMFLPFLGAIAMPRLSFESRMESVFSALMGPGFSMLPAGLCALLSHGSGEPKTAALFAIVGSVIVAINIFNLLPFEPLDGGVALRSIFESIIGKYARIGMVTCGLLTAVCGYLLGYFILAVFGIIAVLANLRRSKSGVGLRPLISLHATLSFASYAIMTALYLQLVNLFTERLTSFLQIINTASSLPL
jgi:Zn-dependent protease